MFGIWYGKGPGVDRTGDVFRHANLAGTADKGGVLALMGDDHGGESSTVCHQSEYAMMDVMIPVLNPANLEEMVDFGLHGWALSRFASVWCGIKCVKDNIESTASVTLTPDSFHSHLPNDFEMPMGGLNIRRADHRHDQEQRLHAHKMRAVNAYVRANKLDRVTVSGGQTPRFGNFQDLQDGDVYIIPAQAELPPATDTEILDFILDKELGWTVLDDWFKVWDKTTMNDLIDRQYDPNVTDLRSAFREAVTELIHNTEL